MEDHCMHQPFLPKYGVFVCVFSWKRAGEISLKYAEHRNAPADGPDYCLNDTLFWLKNISMHRLHPNVNRLTVASNEPDVMDKAKIKNIVLVGTHSNSCDLSEVQKQTIMEYYKEAIRKHTDIYTSVRFEVHKTGAISVENRDELDDDGIGTLKYHLISAAQEVVSQCFAKQMPVYIRCRMKEKRAQFEQKKNPPYDMLSKCHIDASGKYRSVYPKHSFEDMISMFRNIGEIFLV